MTGNKGINTGMNQATWAAINGNNRSLFSSPHSFITQKKMGLYAASKSPDILTLYVTSEGDRELRRRIFQA